MLIGLRFAPELPVLPAVTEPEPAPIEEAQVFTLPATLLVVMLTWDVRSWSSR